MTRWRITLTLFTLFWAVPAWAHTIILRNGQVVYGEVVQQDRTSIFVVAKAGKKTYAKSLVLKILFQEVKEEATIKRIIRTEIARKKPVNEEEEIKIVDFNDYMKEVMAEERQRRFEDERRAALWRSALLPGWGQRHYGQNTRGWIYTGLFLASAYTRFSAYEQNQKAQKDYNDLTVPIVSYTMLPQNTDLLVRWSHYQAIKDRLQSTHENAGRASIAVALVWAVSMLDSAFFGPSDDSANAEKPQVQLILTPAITTSMARLPRSEVGLGLSLAF